MQTGMTTCRIFEAPDECVLDGAQGLCGQKEDGGDEREGSVDGYPEEAEGKQDQPDDGVQDEESQREGPAEEGEDAEEKKVQHEKYLL